MAPTVSGRTVMSGGGFHALAGVWETAHPHRRRSEPRRGPRAARPGSGRVTGSTPAERAGKYALVERERRFLLAGAPEPTQAQEVRRITDRYLTETRIRLRRVDRSAPDQSEFKLTQKVPADRPGPVQGTITTTYLSQAEYDVFAVLPAAVLTKTRLSLPPLGIDVFDAPLHGLILAEAEFTTDEDTHAFEPPADVVAEVTDDPRFTGGRLVQAHRADLIAWLDDYGININQGHRNPSSGISQQTTVHRHDRGDAYRSGVALRNGFLAADEESCRGRGCPAVPWPVAVVQNGWNASKDGSNDGSGSRIARQRGTASAAGSPCTWNRAPRSGPE